ncbi:Miniconductance mechanosensitive channel YbdG [Polaribacter huanghezhanensis]|uniref:mechanosensitive ion channel family protein n=1 Tax=Polaribacter huanghezhanensis TaxID=1354726 RepID=UPI0026483D0E|nr:mechanosensitive ion channel domain-containing protein [Polaribacter huanghezhanensis]WKD84776.1 Miniconductance mechanosensitive channel YbdG [Polaribacter huanghezhanensis]
MNRKWKFVLYPILLIGIIYLKFFNEIASRFIDKYNELQSFIAFLIFYLSVVFVANLAKYIYSKKNKISAGKKNNVHFGIENIANFTVGIAVIIMLISFFSGVNPKDLITSLTIVAAAIAILTKEYIVDFISGIYLSFSNTFEIGDYVKIDHLKGKIVEISMLKVKVLNDDDDIVIIPNSKVHYNEIINYTKRDARFMTVDFQIALKYIDTLEQLEKEIISSLRSFSQYIEPRTYNLKVVEMKVDYLDLKFQYTLKLVDMDMQRKIRKKTIREVFNFISSKKELPIANPSL